METVNKLEVTIAAWYKGLPHLPEGARKWITNSIWWIILVGVILSLMVIIPAFSWLFIGGSLIATYGMSQSVYYGAAFIPAIIALIILVVDLALSIMAISPLKAHLKRGWSLLFVTMLLGVISVILTLFSNQDFGAFLSGLIGTAVGGYFLFEIRDNFSMVATKVHPKPATTTSTDAPKKA